MWLPGCPALYDEEVPAAEQGGVPVEDDDDRHQDDHEVQVREGQVQLPHCDEGREKVELETTDHLLNSCSAYSDFREGIDPELVIEDQA